MTSEPLSSEQNCQHLPFHSDMRPLHANPGSQKSLSECRGGSRSMHSKHWRLDVNRTEATVDQLVSACCLFQKMQNPGRHFQGAKHQGTSAGREVRERRHPLMEPTATRLHGLLRTCRSTSRTAVGNPSVEHRRGYYTWNVSPNGDAAAFS